MTALTLVLLVEERSMKNTLEALLPKILPPNVIPITVPHEGKSDLMKSIPRKIKGWRTPNTQFVVVQDNDNGDCIKLKQKLCRLCSEAGRPESLIRIVCQELEAWFLGDLQAIDSSGLVSNSKFSSLNEKERFRNPDFLADPKSELQKLVPNYRPFGGSQAIAPFLTLAGNRSPSFCVFLDGIKRVAGI